MRWLSARVHLDWLFWSSEFLEQQDKRLAATSMRGHDRQSSSIVVPNISSIDCSSLDIRYLVW
jgi:hypothetical protein